MLTTPEQISPEWLTTALRRNGFLDRGEVKSIENKLTKKMYQSVVSRLGITYSPDVSSKAPTNLFLKISTLDPTRPSSSEHQRKEVEFYNVIAREMTDPAVPRCYDAAYSPEHGNYYLLLEDLSDSHDQPKSPKLPSKIQCEAAVDCLAQLHAFWWDHSQLGKEIGKLFDQNELSTFVDDVEKNVSRFVEFMGDELSVEQRKIYERLIATKFKIWGRLTDAKGLTVTHGDAHWWNFLYPHDTNAHRVCLIDWELWHVDAGARDLAYLVGLGGYSDRRADMEQNLVRHYYDRLIAYGVKNFSWDNCWSDYRWSALRNLNIPVIQWSQGRSADLWHSNFVKAMLAYEDLRCSELLGG